MLTIIYTVLLNCNLHFTPFIEVWNWTNKENLIANFEDIELKREYKKTDGWCNEFGNPMPRKYDVILKIRSNILGYETNEIYSEAIVNLKVKYKFGELMNGNYVCNSQLSNEIILLEGYKLLKTGFKNKDGVYYNLIKVSNIDLMKAINSFQLKKLNLNQIIFEITFISKKSLCTYEYIFGTNIECSD